VGDVGRHCVGMYLLFVWLRGKICVREQCCEVVGSCEVQKVVRCDFLCPCKLIKTCMSVCVWTGMTLPHFMTLSRNGKSWRKVVHQYVISDLYDEG